MKKVFALVLILMLAAPMAFAKQNEVKAGLGPDSLFYGFDKAMEGMGLMFTFNKAAKAEKSLDIAQERLLEFEAMAEQNKTKFYEKAEREYNKALEKAEKAAEQVAEKDQEKIREKVESHYQKVAEVKDKILAKKNETMDLGQFQHLEQVFERIKEKAQNMEKKVGKGKGPGDVHPGNQTQGNQTQRNEAQVVICHRPQGNAGNCQTIHVGASAVQAHLDHGDLLGACPADCGHGNGTAQPECETDGDCPTGYECDVDECVLIPTEECSAHADCGAGYHCVGHKCKLIPVPECTSDLQCDDDEICQNNECVPVNDDTECTSDTPCSTDSDGCCPSTCAVGADKDCCEEAGKCWIEGEGCYDTCSPGTSACDQEDTCETLGDGCCPNNCAPGSDKDCCEEAGKCWRDGEGCYDSCWANETELECSEVPLLLSLEDLEVTYSFSSCCYSASGGDIVPGQPNFTQFVDPKVIYNGVEYDYYIHYSDAGTWCFLQGSPDYGAGARNGTIYDGCYVEAMSNGDIYLKEGSHAKQLVQHCENE
ncbi:V-type ATP synthase subunit E [Candidatus Woesearchaeota archaeon]|nr:V-type ATP synthase subunit E [Candidatus Woesearchaeota archaeon]